jgi:hypothetical protein
MNITYSRAQRYGSNARILARAHVCRSNGDFLEAIVRLLWLVLIKFGYDSMYKVKSRGTFVWRGGRVGDVGGVITFRNQHRPCPDR